MTDVTREPGHDTTPPPSPPGKTLAGRYRLQALLGAGGMGSVYLAEDLELGERVAIKMIRRGSAHDAAFIERLRNEVRLARRVTHPNVARTYDIGEHEGERFLTMEYIEGESLGGRIARLGPFDLASFLRVAREVTAGLAAAHDAGVLHRDLKPHNVLLDGEGRAKIVDFGTAWSTREVSEDRLAGTPSYMAPEQFGGQFDERSDLFGLGAVFYVMLTGSKPFALANPDDRPGRAPDPCGLRPELPVPVGTLVARCLEPVPANRFRNAAGVAEALAAAGAMLTEEQLVPSTVAESTAERVLRTVEARPRVVFLRATGSGNDEALAADLRGQVVAHMNELVAVRAVEDEERAHEASAHVEVRREGDTIVVGVRLVGGQEQYEFWKRTYAGGLGDAVGLARSAARGIEEALAVTSRPEHPLAPLGEEAEALYLRGRAAYQQVWPANVREAIDLYNQALAHSPSHPLIVAGRASALARLAFWQEGTVEDAREASLLAVRLAPTLSEAHTARANADLMENDAPSVARSLARALDLAPGEVAVLTMLASLLLEVGAPWFSLRLCDAALARDPLATEPDVVAARAHALLGHWDGAAGALARMKGPFGKTMGAALAARLAIWRRDGTRGRAILAELHAYDDARGSMAGRVSNLFGEALLHGKSPRLDEEFVHRVDDEASPKRMRTFLCQVGAEMEACIGDYGQALVMLDRAIELGLFDSFWLDRCPLFDEMRGGARFEQAREKVQARARRVLASLQAGSSDRTSLSGSILKLA